MIRELRLLRAAAGSDRDLLDRYVRGRDDEAFEALVRRYGPGVWAACVRLAGRDAEDAFQAVFLTLSRKAGTVTGSLPAWLHAVTRRVAANLRRTARRRGAVEAAAARPPESPAADVDLRDRLALLDEELARLPERYRAVLIVCCLEARPRDEAAEHLGWSDAQVKGRLERARALLRTRLARRGVELGGLLLAAAATGPAPVRAMSPSATVVSLTYGVIRAMTIRKLTLAAAALAAGIGVTLTGGVVLRAQPGEPPPAKPPAAKDPPAKPAGGPAAPPGDGAPTPKNRAGETVQKFIDRRKERDDTLRELVKTSEQLVQAGRADFSEVLDARLLLLAAELDFPPGLHIARGEGSRLAQIYTETIDALKKYEEWATARVQSGRGTQAAVLKIRARRLDVEIKFEEMKDQVKAARPKQAKTPGKPE